MEWFSHVDKINLSNLGIFEFDFWKLKIDGRQCHLQPLMLINDANAIFCHCHPKWKLKITYHQPIKVHHPFSSQPIISLKLGNFQTFKNCRENSFGAGPETDGFQCLGPSNWTICSPLRLSLPEYFQFFLYFILGGQFLLPQRANIGKREISHLQKRMREGVFCARGIQTGPITAH